MAFRTGGVLAALRAGADHVLVVQSVAVERDLHYKDVIAHRYVELIYNGQWFTPLREALDAFVDVT